MPANVGGKQLSNGDLAVAGGFVVGIIATFLPWYSWSYNFGYGLGAESGSFNGTTYWSGWLFLLVALAGLAWWGIRNFVPTMQLPVLPLAEHMKYIVMGAIMVLCAVIFLLAGGSSSYNGPGASAGPSFGLFIGIIAGVAVAAGGFLKQSDPAPAAPMGGGFSTPTGGYTPPPPAPPQA